MELRIFMEDKKVELEGIQLAETARLVIRHCQLLNTRYLIATEKRMKLATATSMETFRGTVLDRNMGGWKNIGC